MVVLGDDTMRVLKLHARGHGRRCYMAVMADDVGPLLVAPLAGPMGGKSECPCRKCVYDLVMGLRGKVIIVPTRDQEGRFERYGVLSGKVLCEVAVVVSASKIGENSTGIKSETVEDAINQAAGRSGLGIGRERE